MVNAQVMLLLITLIWKLCKQETKYKTSLYVLLTFQNGPHGEAGVAVQLVPVVTQAVTRQGQEVVEIHRMVDLVQEALAKEVVVTLKKVGYSFNNIDIRFNN